MKENASKSGDISFLVKLMTCLLTMERMQQRATKCILKKPSYYQDYELRLISLDLLPLLYYLELQDIFYLAKSVKSPSLNFDLPKNVLFCKSDITRKLVFKFQRTYATRQSYFSRIVKLWNAFPEIVLDRSLQIIKQNITMFLWRHFPGTQMPTHSTVSAHALDSRVSEIFFVFLIYIFFFNH